MALKNCSKCSTEKETAQFYKDKNTWDRLTHWCKECCLKSNAKWSQNNRQKHHETNRIYYEKTKDKKHARRMERLHNVPEFKLIHRMRGRLSAALKSKKPDTTIELLGCTPKELKEHLEKQFKLGMTWENYGEWHVDHIVPMARINKDDHESIRRICHYSNLQPLWAIENLVKGAK